MRSELGRLLNERRAELIVTMHGLEEELVGIEASTSQGPDDEHDPEGSTIGYERARVAALLQVSQRSLGEIENALARVGRDEFSTCSRCGGPILVERLLALPTTTRCVRCAR